MTESNSHAANIRRNVLSNYVSLAQRMLTGLVSFRLLYTHLSKEEFGYWALLWSVFGYGLLLDFGLGMTVEKKVAQLGERSDWSELNRILSTIFFSYCAMALVIAGVGFFAAQNWVEVMGVGPENREEFAFLFRMFLFGIAVMFPMGVFTEVLQGLQRIALNNALIISCNLCVFVGMVWALLTGQPVRTVLALSLVGAIGPAILACVVSFRITPMQISLRLFSRSELRAATSFSFIAYFISLSYIVMTKTDLVVLGSMLSVTAVALYQPGAKLAELFTMLTKQVAHVLQPAAAQLYANGTSSQIANLLVGGIRYSALLSTPIYLATAFYLDVLLRVLTGEAQPSTQTLWVGQVLLLWSYSFIITHNVYKRIAVMGGHERRLLTVGIIEAVANLGFSVVSVLLLGDLVGVALGTLVPSLSLGWGVLWGWAAQEAGVSRGELFRATLLSNWLANLPLLLILIALRSLGWTQYAAGPLRLLLGAVLAGAVGIVLIWRVALLASDRALILSKLPFTERPPA